jgi:hypothetical protein
LPGKIWLGHILRGVVALQLIVGTAVGHAQVESFIPGTMAVTMLLNAECDAASLVTRRSLVSPNNVAAATNQDATNSKNDRRGPGS